LLPTVLKGSRVVLRLKMIDYVADMSSGQKTVLSDVDGGRTDHIDTNRAPVFLTLEG
jgi:hypothetical protein